MYQSSFVLALYVYDKIRNYFRIFKGTPHGTEKNKQTEKTSIFCLLRTHENSCTLKKEEVISSVFLKTAFMCVCSMCIAAIIGKLLWTQHDFSCRVSILGKQNWDNFCIKMTRLKDFFCIFLKWRNAELLTYRRVASSRMVYYSILETFGQRSKYISIKFPLHKHSENAWVCY